jgi:hypothetical protein
MKGHRNKKQTAVTSSETECLWAIRRIKLAQGYLQACFTGGCGRNFSRCWKGCENK